MVASPLSGLDCLMVQANVVAEFEQERNGELRDRSSAVCRDIGYSDAARSCRPHVDYVEAGSQDADVAQPRKPCERGRRERRLVGQEHIGILGPLDDFRGGRPLVKREVAELRQRSPIQVARIQGVCIQYDDFRHAWKS